MTRKRLTRDKKWFFQSFPYHQMRMENELFTGLVSVIQLTEGEYLYWEYPKAGKVAVAGKDMVWLQLIPDDGKRAITAKFLPDKSVSVWYVDVIERMEYDDDGVAAFIDKYLDVIFTPQGDVIVADRDELDDAFHSGELTEDQYKAALLEGDAIVNELCQDIPATELWCRKILDLAEAEINKKSFMVFLDIDGVLDVFDSSARVQQLIPEAVERLKRLVTRTNAKVVVISDWRFGSKKHETDGMKDERYLMQCGNWSHLEETFQKESISISGITPWGDGLASRTEEIQAYLQEHPEIYNYVILDDCFGDDYSSDMNMKKHLVYVDALKGLQDNDLVKACEIMNRCSW